MALETGTYVDDLTITNPTSGDPKSQGDDHLRLVKTVLRNTFAGFTGAVVVTGTDGGSANAYTLTPVTPLAGYVTRTLYIFSPNANNTGASTLNVSALGVRSIKSVSGAALVADDLVSGNVYVGVDDGTNINLVAPTKNYIDGFAPLASPAFTGTPTAPTAAVGTSTTQIATTAFAAALAFSSALPAQTGNSGKFVTTDGTSASWGDINDRTDTVITAADEIIFGDVTDSNLMKKDTVQGILDLSPVTLTNSVTLTNKELSDGTTFTGGALAMLEAISLYF